MFNSQLTLLHVSCNCVLTNTETVAILILFKLAASLVLRPHPAFRHLEYRKAGEGLVSFLTSDVRIEEMVERLSNCVWGSLGQEHQSQGTR